MALNVVCMMGRLCADPVLRSTASGKEVASFRIAVDRGRKDGGADFFECVAWEKRADFVCRHFAKGSMIGLTGRLTTRQYEDKDGNKRNATEIVVSEVSFCGSKNEAKYSDRASETELPDVAAGEDFVEAAEEDLPF